MEEELRQNELRQTIAEATSVQSLARDSRRKADRTPNSLVPHAGILIDVITEEDSRFLLIERGKDSGEYIPQHPGLVETFNALTNRSDMVIVGTAENRASRVNETDGFPRTNYDVQNTEIQKCDAHKTLRPGQSITRSRPGGTLLDHNHVIEATDGHSLSLHKGQQCLLFLKSIPGSDFYPSLDSWSSFLVIGPKAICLTRRKDRSCTKRQP